jgi:hypothetical protein
VVGVAAIPVAATLWVLRSKSDWGS